MKPAEMTPEGRAAVEADARRWNAPGGAWLQRPPSQVIGVLLAEIDHLRAALAEWPIREAHFRDELRSSSGKCGQHIPGHHGGSCSLPEGHSGFCEEE